MFVNLNRLIAMSLNSAHPWSPCLLNVASLSGHHIQMVVSYYMLAGYLVIQTQYAKINLHIKGNSLPGALFHMGKINRVYSILLLILIAI